MDLILIAALAVWAVGLVALPVTIWRDSVGGGNAKNLPGFIRMRRGLDYPGAVWAQELYEARLRWLFLPFDVPLVLIGRAVPRLAFYERRYELMGHAIEIEAEAMLRRKSPGARGRDFPSLVHREARALTRYRAFKGWSADRIEKALRKRESAAWEWASLRSNKIFRVQHERAGQ